MKLEEKHTSTVSSKGERLNWKPLKGNKAVQLNKNVVSRFLSEEEIKMAQATHRIAKSSLLVP